MTLIKNTACTTKKRLCAACLLVILRRYSRSVSDGRVLPEGGAESRELLRHRFQLRALPSRHIRIVQAAEGGRAIKGVHLWQQEQTEVRVILNLHWPLVETTYIDTSKRCKNAPVKCTGCKWRSNSRFGECFFLVFATRVCYLPVGWMAAIVLPTTPKESEKKQSPNRYTQLPLTGRKIQFMSRLFTYTQYVL